MMNNVRFVDINYDTFKLIDNSLCVATITGTVGIQALCRGKCVLSFGLSPYRNFELNFNISSSLELTGIFNKINGIPSEQVKHDFRNYLDKTNMFSISGADTHDINDFYKQSYRLNADGLIFINLVKDKTFDESCGE